MSYDGYGYGDDDYYYPEHQSEHYITLTLSPFFLLIGTVGNLMSLIILLQLSREVISTCLYLAVLSIMDLLVLYTRCGNQWLMSITELDISTMLMMSSPSICKVYPFVFNFIFHMMRWLVVSTAIEGVIATKYPDKVNRLCTTSKAEAVMLLLTVLLICINIHFFWSFELAPTDQGPMSYMHSVICTFTRHGHQSSEVFQSYIWPIIDTLVTDGLPSILVSICVIIMLTRIIRGQHRGDDAHRAWRERYQMDPRAMDQLKITFVIICILFIPASLPKMIVNLVTYLFENEYIDYGDDYMAFMSDRNLANAICAHLEYAYLSMKMIIYLASSNRFRQEAKKLIKCSSDLFRMHTAPSIKHTESMASEPLMNQDDCQRSSTENSLKAI
jgi:hypothetical protein